ncbi:hypothetical protein H6A09_05010 [[Clostridium] spiroforme]|nr:hypothetical protein [Thomasclavelia spiroformis]
MAKSHSSTRKTLSYLFSLLIAIFLSIFVVLTVTRFTIMSPNYILKQMNKADFYEQSIIALNEEIQQETQSTGFPIEMFENYLSTDEYKVIIESHMKDAFDNGTTEIDTTQFEQKLDQDINQYIKDNNILINTDSQNAIALMKSNLVELYKSYITFPYVSIVYQVIDTYQSLYLIAAAILVVLIIIASVLLYRLYSHYKGRRRYFAYAISSSGLMCLVLPGVLYFGKFVNKINLSPAYFYDFFTNMFNSYLLIYVIIGFIMIVLANIFAYIKFKR